MKDYLGTPINVGDLGIRVQIQKTYRPLIQFKVVKIDESKPYDQIGILIESGKKMSWVDADKCIIEGSLSQEARQNLKAWNKRFKLKK